RLHAVLAAGPGAREDARDLLEVIEEEARRRLPEALRLRAPERIQAGEDALQLVGERRLRHPPPADAKQLDLAVQRRFRVLVERPDAGGAPCRDRGPVPTG